MHLVVESAQLNKFFPNCSVKLIVLLCLSTFDQNFLKGTVCRKITIQTGWKPNFCASTFEHFQGPKDDLREDILDDDGNDHHGYVDLFQACKLPYKRPHIACNLIRLNRALELPDLQHDGDDLPVVDRFQLQTQGSPHDICTWCNPLHYHHLVYLLHVLP